MTLNRRTFLLSTALLALVRPDLLSASAQEEVGADFNRLNLLFAKSNDVQFKGFFGARYQKSLDRLGEEPIDKVNFVLDDVNFNQKRRFYNYSGDISGRYIEVGSLTSLKDKPTTKILLEVIDEIVQYQQPDGHFGREVDWNKTIDVAGSTDQSLEMPILWGNGRLMLGLFAAYERFGNEKAFEAAKKMADFYVNIVVKRFCDPKRMDEYEQTAKGYAAAYVTCVFHGIEGLVRAYRLTGEKKYLDCAVEMADFHEHFDTLPVGHSHGSISTHEALVMLYEDTGEKKYLDRVVKRWNDAVYGGFVNPSGGVCENFIIKGHSDEGCSEADWLRINLMIWRNTGDVKYLDFAERMLFNEYQMNQWHTGGFGHRYYIADDKGVYAWGERYAESYWCCSYHGPLGYYELKEFLAVGSKDASGKKKIYYNFPLNFATPLDFGGEKAQIVSSIDDKLRENGIVKATIQTSGEGGDVALAVRVPDWANDVVLQKGDETLQATVKDGYAVVEIQVGDAVVVSYSATPYLEDRRFQKLGVLGGAPKQEGVLRFGPHVWVMKGFDGEKINDLKLKWDSERGVKIPEEATCPFYMSDEERNGKYSFVFNFILEK